MGHHCIAANFPQHLRLRHNLFKAIIQFHNLCDCYLSRFNPHSWPTYSLPIMFTWSNLAWGNLQNLIFRLRFSRVRESSNCLKRVSFYCTFSLSSNWLPWTHKENGFQKPKPKKGAFIFDLFSCPGQLDWWPCHSLNPHPYNEERVTFSLLSSF